MGFYYLNLFSLLFLVMICVIAISLFWLFWTKGLGRNFRGPVVWIVIAAILVAPWIEEFWIAYNFDQSCKEAGLFIYKKVKAKGFYDDTHGWRADKLRASGYFFVEGRDGTSDPNSYWRHERANDEVRSFKIDRPTARYHYSKPHAHTLVTYKITMFEYLVRDVQTNEVLAREKTYAREAPWYFIGLDRPTRFCSVSGTYGEKIRATIYDLVLQPVEHH